MKKQAEKYKYLPIIETMYFKEIENILNIYKQQEKYTVNQLLRLDILLKSLRKLASNKINQYLENKYLNKYLGSNFITRIIIMILIEEIINYSNNKRKDDYEIYMNNKLNLNIVHNKVLYFKNNNNQKKAI